MRQLRVHVGDAAGAILIRSEADHLQALGFGYHKQGFERAARLSLAALAYAREARPLPDSTGDGAFGRLVGRIAALCGGPRPEP